MTEDPRTQALSQQKPGKEKILTGELKKILSKLNLRVKSIIARVPKILWYTFVVTLLIMIALPYITLIDYLFYRGLFLQTISSFMVSGFLNLTLIFGAITGLILTTTAIAYSKEIRNAPAVFLDLFIALMLSIAGVIISISLGLYNEIIDSGSPIMILVSALIHQTNQIFFGIFVFLAIILALLFILVLAFVYSSAGRLIVNKGANINTTPLRSAFPPVKVLEKVLSFIRDKFTWKDQMKG